MLSSPGRRLKETTSTEISDALERIVIGVEKKGSLQSEEKRRIVAVHEAGHALVGALLPECAPPSTSSQTAVVARQAKHLTPAILRRFLPRRERFEGLSAEEQQQRPAMRGAGGCSLSSLALLRAGLLTGC